jgi:hemerythrin
VKNARIPGNPTEAAGVGPLGYEPMDSMHDELAHLLALFTAPGAVVDLRALNQVHDHLTRHFAEEDAWMTGSDFPPRDCHMDEHAAVIRSCAEVLALAETGDLAAAHGFIQALADWFPGHADYLDSALAAWMCHRRFGGKPVILHRGVVQGETRNEIS